MKIVIDIPENMDLRNYDIPYDILNIITSGISLPEHHGDLIDRSKIYKAIPAEEDNCTGMGMTLEEMDAYNDGIDAMYNLMRGAKPIIKAESEDKG